MMEFLITLGGGALGAILGNITITIVVVATRRRRP